jgi:hypothetical protein
MEESVHQHILNLYRSNTNMVSIISRYYNDPPQGGYVLTEDHEYILRDMDDIHSILFVEELVKNCKNMPKKNFKKLHLKKVKEADPVTNIECSICLDHFKKNEFYRLLDCNHHFHKKCIDRWIKKDHNDCPMCRTKINLS